MSSTSSSTTERAKKQIWHDKSSAFQIYGDLSEQLQNLRISAPPPKPAGILKQMSVSLPKTLKRCNPKFLYELKANPKRNLTKPAEPALNGGHDNINHDLIIHVNDIFEPDPPSSGPQYRVVDLLGQGTFGQVVKCINLVTKETVAIKVVKNKRAYYDQGIVELKIIRRLNHEYDPDDKNHIVRLKDYFQHHNHLCLVFELLSINLYELIKMNLHRGFSMNLLRIFLQQIIQAQSTLLQAKCIHCDLKPENILLCDLSSPQIKVIDFGSACYENQTVFSYIQSRFYRSPEVILGVPYTSAIDVWSIGCIAAELFFGLPLFPGNSEYNQISRIIDMFGIPPDWMLQQGKNTRKYFTMACSITGAHARINTGPQYQLKSAERYAMDTRTKIIPTKKYFTHSTLTENILNFRMKSGLSADQITRETNLRSCLAHFLNGLLQLDPMLRWTPDQALLHPFITEAPYDPNWQPPRPKVTTAAQPIPIQTPTPIGYQDSSFSPRSHFQFQLGASPSTNYSPHGSYGSSPMHMGSLPKDGSYNSFYPPPGSSPMYMIPPMPNSGSYNQPSFHLGNTPTMQSFYKPQYQNSPQEQNLPAAAPLSSSQRQQSKSYRSSQRNSFSRHQSSPYSPSRSPFKTSSGQSGQSSLSGSGNSVSGTNHSPKGPDKRTHRKMPSTGQFGLSSFQMNEPTFITKPGGSSVNFSSSGEPSPIVSPRNDGDEWDDQFYLEDGDISPVSNVQTPPTSRSQAIPMQQQQRTPGNNFAPMDPNVVLGSSPAYNTFQQSYSQRSLSYDQRTNGTSYLDPSIFPFRSSEKHFSNSFTKKR